MPRDKYHGIFAGNLRHFMEINDKTQLDICRDLGFDKSAVSTWVNGRNLPRMGAVNALAEYFRCRPSDLLEEKQEPEYYDLDTDMREIVRFLAENPEYKAPFNALTNIGKEDIGLVTEILERMNKDGKKGKE